MEQKELDIVKNLIKKYNDVLMNSMSIALAEDLVNLIVVNGEDKDFKLLDLVKDKTNFRLLVANEFLKLNSNSVLSDLRLMEDEFEFSMVKKKNQKSSQKKFEF